MSLYDWLTISCWLFYLIYMIVASVSVKRDKGKADWQSNDFALWSTFLFLIVLLTLALRQPIVRFFALGAIIPDISILEAFGTIVVAAGIAFALWARIHLGRNWSSEPSVKEDHHLVTSGPYHFVRHPIYAGVLAAVLGSILVGGVVWLVVLLFVSVAFTYRMQKEEQLLGGEFPDQYPSYRKRTKALIPFVW